MKKKWSNLLKIVLSLALLVVVLTQVNLGDLWREVRDINLALFALAILAYLVGIGIRAYRWQMLFRALGDRVPYWRLAELYMVGMFFNQFLPTGFGGDVVRVYEVSRKETQTSTAISTTLADRLTGILGSSLVALTAVLMDRRDVPVRLAQTVFVVSFGITFATGMLTQRRWLDAIINRVRLLQRLVSIQAVHKLYQALTGYTVGDIAKTVLVSLPFTFTLILNQWFIAQALGVNLDIKYFFLFEPLLALATVLPISLNGLGVREGMYQLLFVPVGVSPTAAMAMSLTYQVARLIVALLGGCVYIASGLREQFARERSGP